MKRDNDKMQRELTDQELRCVVGGTRSRVPTSRVGGSGGNGGTSEDPFADRYERKG